MNTEDFSGSIELVLSALKNAGFSKGQAVVFLMELSKIEDKKIIEYVHNAECWESSREIDDKLLDAFLEFDEKHNNDSDF